MLGIEGKTFFFEQKRKKRFQQRRIRKLDDTHSVVGGGREGITFLVGDQEGDAVSVLGGRLGGYRRPGSSFRRISQFEPPFKLPPIDPGGPHLVTGTAPQTFEEVEVRSVVSERKVSILQEVEGKLHPPQQEIEKKALPRHTWSLSEARFASSGILSKLKKQLVIFKDKEDFEITLPEEIVEFLSQKYEGLIAGTVVEKREWQTGCYLEYKSKNKHPFLTSTGKEAASAGEGVSRADIESALKGVANKTGKKVTMSKETKKEQHVHPERPQTARSIMSNFSFKSEPSEDATSTFTTDYDRLPEELRPNILNYRRESLMPKMKRMGPQTRMERAKGQHEEMKSLRPKKEKEEKSKKEKEEILKMEQQSEKKSMRKVSTVATAFKRLPSASAAPKKGPKSRPATARSTLKQLSQQDGGTGEHFLAINVPKTTINFSVEKSDDDQGYIVHPSDAEDPEAYTLRMWEKRLKELHRAREESQYMDKKNGADKAMVVKFYNKPHHVRTKHQRSATVPLPTIFSKLPPSVASFSTPVANEAMMIGDGAVFVLSLPDGSGYCNYLSGRQAISQNRCNKEGPLRGCKGLYTLVFDDKDEDVLLAYFTPTGKACCYYQSGAIRMISDSMGGRLYSEDGEIIKKWEWPPPKLSMPVSISLYLNVYVSLRCSSLTNMDLRISTRGHSYKFPVGPSMEDLDQDYSTKDLVGGTILSTCPLISRAAKSQSKYPSGGEGVSSLDARRKVLVKRKATQNLGNKLKNSLTDLQEDHYSDDLDAFKKNIKTLVDDWIKHYCKTMKIDVPALFSSPASPASVQSRGVSGSRSRMVKSSMAYTGLSRPSISPNHLRRTRSLTHPQFSRPSSRPITPSSPNASYSHSAIEDGVEDGSFQVPSSHPASPHPAMRPVSPLDYIQHPLTSSGLHNKPFKVGKAKSAKEAARKPSIGCPIALHNMLWRNLEEMPACKCDKRKIPYICDMEYDIFLLSHVPKEQLIIVCVTSSLELSRSSCTYEPMIQALYTNQNRLRFSPCSQSSHDLFRLLKYDIAHTSSMSGLARLSKDKPLLVGRHNAMPGMFLMYLGGKLVSADYMFNGYSITKKDFIKQIRHSIKLGKEGKFMPYDFRFSRNTGTKIPRSNTWAYPVSGFMQNLIPFSPQSDSQVTSRSLTPASHENRRVSVIVTESEEPETEQDSTNVSQLTLSCPNSLLKVPPQPV